MAMFSEGGVTSPDIWIVISIIIIALISIVLNPLVFRHNFYKKKSLARDLYMALSATDFLSSIVLSTFFSVGILSPKDKQCFTIHNATFCETEYIRYYRPATLVEKLVGSLAWYLGYSPLCITSVLSISRWYQISFPLRPLNRRKVEVALLVMCLFWIVYFPVIIFNDTEKTPTQIRIAIQTVWNARPFGAEIPNFVTYIFGNIPVSVSTITSALTVWKIVESGRVPGNHEPRVRKVRSTVKILLLNLGNISYIATLLILALAGWSQTSNLGRFTTISVMPIVLSMYNPIVYTLLTNGVFRRNNSVRR